MVCNAKIKNKPMFSNVLQVFDATNTTRERRDTIIQFAEQNGFKVTVILGGHACARGRFDVAGCSESAVLLGQANVLAN